MKNRLQKISPYSCCLEKKSLAKIGIVVAIMVTVFIASIFGTPFDWKQHDSRLATIVSAFDNIPLPLDTKQVGATFAQLGRLGNGNHCDYIVSKLIDTKISEQELYDYYDKQRITLSEEIKTVLLIKQPWKEAVTFGSYVDNNEKMKNLILFQENKKKDVAGKYKIPIQTLTDAVFEVSFINYGNRANDPRCR